MKSFGWGGPDLRQEPSHRFGIHARANPPSQFSLQRADRAVNMLELPFVAIVHHQTLRRGSLAAPKPHHPSKAGLGLKHQPNLTPLDDVWDQQSFQCFREFFPTPPEPPAGSWDGVCRGPLSASQGVPANGSRPRAGRVGRAAAPARPASGRRPPTGPWPRWPATVSSRRLLPPGCGGIAGVHPSCEPGCLPPTGACGRRPEGAARWHGPRPERRRLAPGWPRTRPAAAPPDIGAGMRQWWWW